MNRLFSGILIFAGLLIWSSGCRSDQAEKENGLMQRSEMQNRKITLAGHSLRYISEKWFEATNKPILAVFYGEASEKPLCVDVYVWANEPNKFQFVGRDLSSWTIDEFLIAGDFINIRRLNERKGKVAAYSYFLTSSNTMERTMSEFIYDSNRKGVIK